MNAQSAVADLRFGKGGEAGGFQCALDRYTQRSVPYLLDQTPRLLFISSRNFVRLLFESGY